MGSQSRVVREKQYEKARRDLAGMEEKLRKKGLKPEALEKNSEIKALKAKVRQINSALETIGRLEKKNEELKKHKAEKAAKPPEKKKKGKKGAKKDKAAGSSKKAKKKSDASKQKKK